MSVGKIPRFSGASREQNVNKSWVNKQLTGMLAFWRVHMESSVVNKQLMVHSNLYIPVISICIVLVEDSYFNSPKGFGQKSPIMVYDSV